MAAMTAARSVAIAAVLGFHASHATPCIAPARAAEARLAQERSQEDDRCGWIGVGVSPMTAAFAQSLGMAQPYGAIFDRPEPHSPAAHAHIEAGDVLTTVNGAPLQQAADFAGIIVAMAPGTMVYLYTFRDGQPRQVALVLGAGPCREGG
jgi:serine protease Do